MEARDFKVGDRVKLSEDGEQYLPRMRSKTGVVTRLHRARLIYVLKDGQKSASLYHPDYWTHETSGT